MKKIQIIGKITGIEPERAKHKFLIAKTKLEMKGYEVFNPFDFVAEGLHYNDQMKVCLKNLEDMDAVYLLPDWIISEGSKKEVKKALDLNLEIKTFYKEL